MRYTLIGVLLIGACGNPAGPDGSDVRVTMMARTTGGPARTVITVTNQGRNPVFLGSCGVWIQFEIDQEWRTAYSPPCGGAVTTVNPSTSHVREYPVVSGNTFRPAVGYSLTVDGDEIQVFGAPADW